MVSVIEHIVQIQLLDNLQEIDLYYVAVDCNFKFGYRKYNIVSILGVMSSDSAAEGYSLLKDAQRKADAQRKCDEQRARKSKAAKQYGKPFNLQSANAVRQFSKSVGLPHHYRIR
jgi:hypothetical protein